MIHEYELQKITYTCSIVHIQAVCMWHVCLMLLNLVSRGQCSACAYVGCTDSAQHALMWDAQTTLEGSAAVDEQNQRNLLLARSLVL